MRNYSGDTQGSRNTYLSIDKNRGSRRWLEVQVWTKNECTVVRFDGADTRKQNAVLSRQNDNRNKLYLKTGYLSIDADANRGIRKCLELRFWTEKECNVVRFDSGDTRKRNALISRPNDNRNMHYLRTVGKVLTHNMEEIGSSRRRNKMCR